jgi:hypothetical protein
MEARRLSQCSTDSAVNEPPVTTTSRRRRRLELLGILPFAAFAVVAWADFARNGPEARARLEDARKESTKLLPPAGVRLIGCDSSSKPRHALYTCRYWGNPGVKVLIDHYASALAAQEWTPTESAPDRGRHTWRLGQYVAELESTGVQETANNWAYSFTITWER